MNNICVSCMQKHKIITVKVKEINIYKGLKLKYNAVYHYCKNTNMHYATNEMIDKNYNSLIKAYKERKLELNEQN